MAKTTDTTAQTIVRAALECLEQYGLEGITVRKIASHAKVNVAAINYHFGSKEKLLEQVFELATESAFMDIDQFVSAESGQELQEQLKTFLEHYAQGALQYPNVSKVLIHELMKSGQQQKIIAQHLEVFLVGLNQRFAKLHQRHPDDFEIRFRSLHMISLFIALGLLPSVFQTTLDLDLANDTTRARLIEHMLE